MRNSKPFPWKTVVIGLVAVIMVITIAVVITSLFGRRDQTRIMTQPSGYAQPIQPNHYDDDWDDYHKYYKKPIPTKTVTAAPIVPVVPSASPIPIPSVKPSVKTTIPKAAAPSVKPPTTVKAPEQKTTKSWSWGSKSSGTSGSKSWSSGSSSRSYSSGRSK